MKPYCIIKTINKEAFPAIKVLFLKSDIFSNGYRIWFSHMTKPDINKIPKIKVNRLTIFFLENS